MPYDRALQADRERNKLLLHCKLLALFRVESGRTKPSPAACVRHPPDWRKRSLCTFFPFFSFFLFFFPHECCLVRAVGEACSWNCFVVSLGLTTPWHLQLIGCEERSDWYRESTSVLVWSRWCYCGREIKPENLISRKSQSVEACGLTQESLVSASGRRALMMDKTHTYSLSYSYPFLRGQAWFFSVTSQARNSEATPVKPNR